MESDPPIRTVIIGDSLAQPRPGVDYSETWPSLLMNRFPEWEIIDRSQGGATSNRLSGERVLEWIKPDFVITQIGIVDCAPRYSNSFERHILIPHLPDSVVSPYMEMAKKVRKRSPRRAYVDLETFKTNLTEFYERASEIGTTVISIIIAPPTSEYLQKSPLISDQIEKYNREYYNIGDKFENVLIINPYKKMENVDENMVDELHVGPDGHCKIFNELEESLLKIIKRASNTDS